jgi:alpha-tubulin suppressor-like RCC1 family protein
LWAWGANHASCYPPLGHGEQTDCPLPKPIDSLRGVKVDAAVTGHNHTLALADDGSVYAWGRKSTVQTGVLGLCPSVSDAGHEVPTPQRIPALRMVCGL